MLGALALLLLHAAATGAAGAVPSQPDVLVTVRTEGRVALDRDALARIGSHVRELWRPYADIRLSLAEAGREARLPGGDGELTLVITDRALPGHDESSLGWIEFVNGRPAQTITVSTTAARILMNRSSWNGRPLSALPPAVGQAFLVGALGRSIAHEIGHYLLASREHAVRGLMRARFAASDILVPRSVNDRLNADEVRRINRQLREYAARAETLPPVF